jgi:hypothetical protein
MVQQHLLEKVYSYLDRNDLFNYILPFYEKSNDIIFTKKLFDMVWPYIEDELNHNYKINNDRKYSYLCFSYYRLYNWIIEDSIYFRYYLDKISDEDLIFIMERDLLNHHKRIEYENYEKICNVSLHQYMNERLKRMKNNRKTLLFTHIRAIKLKRWDILEYILRETPNFISKNKIKEDIRKIKNLIRENHLKLEEYEKVKEIYCKIMEEKALIENKRLYLQLNRENFDINFYLQLFENTTKNKEMIPTLEKRLIELLKKYPVKFKLNMYHIKFILMGMDIRRYYDIFSEYFVLPENLYENLCIPIELYLDKVSYLEKRLEWMKIIKEEGEPLFLSTKITHKIFLSYIHMEDFKHYFNAIHYFKDIVNDLIFLEYVLKEHTNELQKIKLKEVSYSENKYEHSAISNYQTEVENRGCIIENVYQLLFYLSIQVCNKKSLNLFYEYNKDLKKLDSEIYSRMCLYQFLEEDLMCKYVNEDKVIDFLINLGIRPDIGTLRFFIQMNKKYKIEIMLKKGCDTGSILYVDACKRQNDEIFSMLLKKKILIDEKSIHLCFKIIEENLENILSKDDKILYHLSKSNLKMIELMKENGIESKESRRIYDKYEKMMNEHKNQLIEILQTTNEEIYIHHHE